MTSEKFLAVQAEIRQSPTPLWERWTIDEVEEEFARVLITRAGNTAQLRDIAGAVMTDASPEAPGRTMAPMLREQAMRAELDPASEEWSEECFGFAPRRRLAGFLRGRGGKPGLPSNRPLREGDVFWVLVGDWVGFSGPPSDMKPDELEAHMRALKEANADVWDVTAAARQASKRSSHEVLRRSNEDAETHAEAEHA